MVCGDFVVGWHFPPCSPGPPKYQPNSLTCQGIRLTEWHSNITLEIANLGPFDFILEENAVIAQLTVATISSPPKLALRVTESQTQGQTGAEGRPAQE